jgi:hypothetical protein
VKLKREKIDLVEGCKISDGVIEQIKNFPLDERNLPKLNSDQELLVNKLISNKSLRERYKKYGLCLECNQPNTGYEYWSRTYWCQSCNGKHFQQDFKN